SDTHGGFASERFLRGDWDKTGKGIDVKRSMFASIIFFYSALLLTMFVMPMVVTAHGDVARAESWDRLLDFPGGGTSNNIPRQKQLRPVPNVGGTAQAEAYDKSFPDAAMITRPSKTRVKTVKA